MENKKLQAIANLPPIPSVAQKVILAMNNPNLNADEIAEMISEDPGLSARVISAANTAFFTGQREVFSVVDAIVRLGVSRVQVITTSILVGLRFKTNACKSFDVEKYWSDAINLAMCASKMAKHVPFEAPAEAAYICGLLHNIGVLICAYLFPKEMEQVFSEHNNNPQISVDQLQFDLMGFSASEAGADVVSRWGLPDAVTEVVSNIHNDNYEGEYPVLIKLMRFCREWVANEYTNIPHSEIRNEISDKTLSFVTKMSIRDKEQMVSFVSEMAGAA